MKVVLPILFNTDETQVFKDAGIDYDLTECHTREVIFYNINCIFEYIDDNKLYTMICANGDEFLCPLHPEVVERIIDASFKDELINTYGNS